MFFEITGFVLPPSLAWPRTVYGSPLPMACDSPTSVVSVDLVYQNGAVLSHGYIPGSPELQFRMEGESEKTWYFEMVHAQGYTTALRPAFTT